MKRTIATAVALIAAASLSAAGATGSPEFPAPAGFVTDAAGLLTPGERRDLESAIRDYERKTSIEIAVVTVRSLGGLTDTDYAQKLGERWGVGKRGKDNGVILLLAVTERKLRIHTGYGIEPDLTDAAAGRIIREVVAPHLARGKERWATALTAGVGAIIISLGERPFQERLEARKPKTAPAVAPAAAESGSDAFPFVILFVFLGLGAAAVITFFMVMNPARVPRGHAASTYHPIPVTPANGRNPRAEPSRSSRRRATSSRRRSDDEDDFTTGVVVGALLSGSSRSSESHPSSVGDSSSDSGLSDFGGGTFGGGGASGDF